MMHMLFLAEFGILAVIKTVENVYKQIDRHMDNKQKQNMIGLHEKIIDISCIQGRHLIHNV